MEGSTSGSGAGRAPSPTARHCLPQASHLTVRPLAQISGPSTKYRVAHLGQVSIMSGLGRLRSSVSGSPIFTPMSRTPATALMETEPVAGDEPAVLRLVRAFASPSAEGEIGGAVTLTLEAGASHFLTGGPGSGKSALLEMIALARPPARGGAALFGRDLAAVPPGKRYELRRRIGMMFQDQRLALDLSVYDNVALAALAAGRRREDYEGQLQEVLGWVGMRRRLDEAASALDPEGRRRLALARAVINRPDLILADEPDGGSGTTILKMLAELNQAGTAVLIATADTALAAASGAEVTRLAATTRSAARA